MIWMAVLAAAAGCFALKLAGWSVPERWVEGRRVGQAAVPHDHDGTVDGALGRSGVAGEDPRLVAERGKAGRDVVYEPLRPAAHLGPVRGVQERHAQPAAHNIRVRWRTLPRTITATSTASSAARAGRRSSARTTPRAVWPEPGQAVRTHGSTSR